MIAREAPLAGEPQPVDNSTTGQSTTAAGRAEPLRKITACSCGHPLAEHYANGCGWCICKVAGTATEDADQATTTAAHRCGEWAEAAATPRPPRPNDEPTTAASHALDDLSPDTSGKWWWLCRCQVAAGGYDDRDSAHADWEVHVADAR